MATYENLYTYLKTAGGSREANVNGSSTPVDFFYLVAAGDTLALERVMVFIADTAAFTSDLYGSAPALTNGITLKVVRADDSELDLLDGFPIKTNSDWQALCYDIAFPDSGAGDKTAVARWTLGRAGKPLILEGGDKLVVTIRDNCTVLTGHRFHIQGIIT